MSDEHWSQGLFEKPIERVIALFEDDVSYEFDIYDAVLVDGKWHLVNTAGCSCPSYEEMAQAEFGPSTLAQIRDHIAAEYPQPYYDKMRTECLKALDEVLARAQDDDALGR